MSDSDDTDTLLLIPPDYYLNNAEDKVLYDDIKALRNRQYTNLQQLESLELQYSHRLPKRDFIKQFEAMNLDTHKNGQTNQLIATSSKFLPSTRKAELNHINGRLHDIEREDIVYNDNPSDISSISTNTVRTQFGPSKRNRQSVGIIHSTPKYMSSSFRGEHHTKEASSDVEIMQFGSGDTNEETTNMVRSMPINMSSSFKKQSPPRKNNDCSNAIVSSEMDNFLLNDGIVHNESYWQRQSDDYCLEHQLQQNAISDLSENHSMHANSLPHAMQTLPQEKAHASSCYQISKTANDLISLSEIWGRSGQATAIATSSQSNLKEEQLRRQHLEKTIRQLQARLLEYQQRLSVAIEVDRTKDNALNNAQIEIKSLNQEIRLIRKNLQDSEQNRKNNDDKLETLQKELSQAVGLASKFQEKTEKLEQELSTCSRKTNETCNQYKQKVDELEIRAHASKRSEELATNELHKIRDKYAKSEHLYEKTKLRCEELEKENSNLKHQKDILQEYHQKQKNRAENLEAQRKSLQESLANSTENETTLRKKLELQQKTLKSHYQQQLENVVAQKLIEFQEQLDKNEEALKSEARERERLIAERAVKQLELINEKNELELNLLQQKHNEEVELYRIQLANASKKIDDMEMKLNVYKSKRADIAEKLHNVMEIQWQKALEILTSPHNLTQTTYNETEHGSPSPDTNQTHKQFNKENEYETPKSSTKENNLNIVYQNGTSPRDKLQAYIELLLSKSPTDFDKLDEILALTSKSKETKDRLEKAAKRQCHSKPPWKV